MSGHMQYPSVPIHPSHHHQPGPSSSNGPAKLWVLQGFNSPTTPGGALNGITNDFANIQIPKTPRTPKTPKGVAVPSRDGNLTELGYPNWVSIFDALLRKITDEAQYGNYLGLDSSADGSGQMNAQAAHGILQACIGAHLPAFKNFLNQQLRAAPSTLPASPNPASITAPIPPLSQQILLTQLSTFLSSSLLNHQLQQLTSVMIGQVYFILGEILRGAGFPVETHVFGKQSGGACGLRLVDSIFQARVMLFRTCMEAQRAASRARGVHHVTPIFYLSPSHAHSLGFPDTQPRYAWELGIPQTAFKILPLTPTQNEATLSAVARKLGKIDPTTQTEGSPHPVDTDMPNPFLTYMLDARSLEAEIQNDLQLAQAHQHQGNHQGGNVNVVSLPCAIFATRGNIAGLDLPYEYDDLEELAIVSTKYALSLHAEGSNLWSDGRDSQPQSQPHGHGQMNGSSSIHVTSTLFDSVDSITIQPGQWLGLPGPGGPALIVFRDPRFLPGALQPSRAANGLWKELQEAVNSAQVAGDGGVQQGGNSMLTLQTTLCDEFHSLFQLWFNLLQINAASFSTLLIRLAAKQSEKIASLRRIVNSQNFPSFIAPAGEGDEERALYVQVTQQQHSGANGTGAGNRLWLPPVPSHLHLFFYLGLPQPWLPRDFNFTHGSLNSYLSHRLSQRLQAKLGEYQLWSRLYGLHLLPVVHFEKIGFLYNPSPVSIWTTDTQVNEELAIFTKILVEVMGEELTVIESNGKLREEFKELLLAEGNGEWVYVPAEALDVQTGSGTIGLGAVRYVPPQVPEHHLDEIATLLNEQLERLQSAMHIHTVPPSQSLGLQGGSASPQASQMISMYRAGRTRADIPLATVQTDEPTEAMSTPQQVCTILDVSELVLRKGLREILGELKITASKLVYPQHIIDDLNETLKQGIRLAEEKITTKSVDAYRPTNVLRWIPVVGSVLNWVAPQVQENGQQFDMKRRELSSIKYSYSNSSTSGGSMSTPSMSRKGSNSGISVSTSSISTPGSSSYTNTPSMNQTPLVTPSPLSINQTAQAQAQQAIQQQQQQQQLAQTTLSSAPTPLSLSTANSPQQSNLLQQQQQPPVQIPQQVTRPATQQQQVPQQSQPQNTIVGAGAGASRPPQHFSNQTQPGVIVNTSAPPGLTQPGQQYQVQSGYNQQSQPQQLQQQVQQQVQPQRISQPIAQQQQQQPQPAPANVPVSISSRTIPPVKITLDEVDKPFVQDLNNAPRSLQQDQLALLTHGETFLAYFPNAPEDGSAPPSDAATSVTKLFLFLEPAYQPTREEASELGVQPDQSVSLLVWCEPGQRYVKTDQAVAVEQVASLHLGANEVFPRQSVRGNCFSLVTQHVALHLEADSAAKRKAWFLALYTLVSQQPVPVSQQQQQQQVVRHQPQQQVHSQQQAPQNAFSPSSGQQTEADEERAVTAARALLEGGQSMTVYVLDKHDIDLTTRHEVVLWMRPSMPGTNQPHCLCWCRRGGALDYSPSRSLPLNRTVQICVGKQTKAFKNAAAANADPAASFSVMVEKMILNLEAMSADERANWLSAFHTVMSASGKRRVFDESEQQQQQPPATA